MAYLIGIVTPAELQLLTARGWEVNELDQAGLDDLGNLRERMMAAVEDSAVMVHVDNDLFKIMDGPDWDKSVAAPAPEDQEVKDHLRALAADQGHFDDELKDYIVTWTVTLKSDSADGAVESALDVLAAGNISPEVEEVDDGE